MAGMGVRPMGNGFTQPPQKPVEGGASGYDYDPLGGQYVKQPTPNTFQNPQGGGTSGGGGSYGGGSLQGLQSWQPPMETSQPDYNARRMDAVSDRELERQQTLADRATTHSTAVSDAASQRAADFAYSTKSMQALLDMAKANGLLGKPGGEDPITYGSPDTTAASDAIFARSKDRAAQTGQAAMRGLTGELQARGVGGAGYEGGRIGRIEGQAESAVASGNRDATEMELGANEHAADQNFAGKQLSRQQEMARQMALLGAMGAAGKPSSPLTGLISALKY